MLWEPEAENLEDKKWKKLAPVIENMNLITDNNAAYGVALATPPAALRVITVPTTKMTTNDEKILAPEYPRVELLDWHASVVRGVFAKDVEINAKLFESEAKLFGGSVAKANNNDISRV